MRKKERLQNQIKSTLKNKAIQISEKIRNKQQQEWEQALHDNFRQIEKVQKINIQSAILLCAGTKIRQYISSSLILDALFFLIPAGYNFLSADQSALLKVILTKLFVFFGIIVLFAPYFINIIRQSKKKFKDPGLLLLALVFLGITLVFVLQLLELGEKSNKAPLIIEGILSLLAMGTLYQGLRRVYQSPHRPQINHLLRAVYFFGSLVIIRLAAVLFSFLTALTEAEILPWILFEITALLLISNIDLPKIYRISPAIRRKQ